MAKTCRTCTFACWNRECGRKWAYDPIRKVCDNHEPRETPLLVDRLAKMVRLLMSPVGDAISERAEAICAAKTLLEDYQEEVGDA